MVKSAIYIPTKCRPAFAAKCARSIADLKTGLPIYLVTEKQHFSELESAIKSESISGGTLGAYILSLNGSNRGIGYARQAILEHADARNVHTIAMIDDDQDMRGDVGGWLQMARRSDVVGIGAWKGYYGLLWSNTAAYRNVKEDQDPGLYGCTGAQGHQAVAFNVANALKVGGYDPEVKWFEDGEMARQAIASGRPWWVYTGVQAGDFATQRYLRENDPGGHNSPGANDGPLANHRRVQAKWPKYISAPPKRYSVQWRKMWRDYLPEFPLHNWPPMNTRSDSTWGWRTS
jgi:hypothetical protein